MSETEFYDIGGTRADPDFIHTKIRVGMESAMVMNHDTDMLEVWVDGVLEGEFASDDGIAATDLLRDLTAANDA